MHYTTLSNLSRRLQRNLRAVLADDGQPVLRPTAGKAVSVKFQKDAPAILSFAPGLTFHYETRGGARIHHPSAYRKRGWSNCVYVAAIPSCLIADLDWALANGYTPEGEFGNVAALSAECAQADAGKAVLS